MKFEIKHRFSGAVLFSLECGSLKLCVEAAAKSGASLDGAFLRGASLRGAFLHGAFLHGASLDGAKINWQSHALLGEILLRAARHDVEKRIIAGLIAISTDWCWEKFLALSGDPGLREWALRTLAEYVQDNDGAPDSVRAFAAKKPETAKP